MRLVLNLHLRRGRGAAALGASGGSDASVLPIGEPGLAVAPCPGCNRPLRAGTRRCPACGMRFLIGVRLRSAVLLLVAGFAVGLAAGGSIVTAGVVAGLPGVLRAAAPAEPVASAAVTESPPTTAQTTTPPGPESIPAPARSALLVVAATNARLAAGRAALQASLAEPTFDVATTAAAIRSVAAEAAAGTDQLARLATWTRATSLTEALRGFYDELRATARSGLSYSMTDGAAYRATAEALVVALDGLPELDVDLAVLLDAAGLEAPKP